MNLNSFRLSIRLLINKDLVKYWELFFFLYSIATSDVFLKIIWLNLYAYLVIGLLKKNKLEESYEISFRFSTPPAEWHLVECDI